MQSSSTASLNQVLPSAGSQLLNRDQNSTAKKARKNYLQIMIEKANLKLMDKKGNSSSAAANSTSDVVIIVNVCFRSVSKFLNRVLVQRKK